MSKSGIVGGCIFGVGLLGLVAGAWDAARVPGPSACWTGSDRIAGDLEIAGDVIVSGSKQFRIDHPLDPANRYLIHFATEGPEPFNVYAGRVIADGDGQARVDLPEWFEAVNSRFRYQLTPIGAPAPELHIAREIQANHFLIAGGRAGQAVSWEVRARRNDRTMRRLEPVPEMEKPAHLRGTFLDPVAWGDSSAPASEGPNR